MADSKLILTHLREDDTVPVRDVKKVVKTRWGSYSISWEGQSEPAIANIMPYIKNIESIIVGAYDSGSKHLPKRIEVEYD